MQPPSPPEPTLQLMQLSTPSELPPLLIQLLPFPELPPQPSELPPQLIQLLPLLEHPPLFTHPPSPPELPPQPVQPPPLRSLRSSLRTIKNTAAPIPATIMISVIDTSDSCSRKYFCPCGTTAKISGCFYRFVIVNICTPAIDLQEYPDCDILSSFPISEIWFELYRCSGHHTIFRKAYA